ncbi:MAG TPA: hypothetical protein VJ813_06210, partial [Vicinamibacterales bacterium]|nr:hypothetical protein [Vicinamibacterales bacterium]
MTAENNPRARRSMLAPKLSLSAGAVLIVLGLPLLLLAQAPGQASNPSPANDAIDVPTSTPLAWTAASGATKYDVRLGTTTTPGLVARNVTSPYQPEAPLAPGTRYYWRIDARGKGNSITAGPVWTFVTAAAAAAPSAPASPAPADGATDVPLAAALGWAASSNATSYDVAFGTTNTPPAVSLGQATTAYDPPGDLAEGTTYFWRVTAIGPGGATAGPLWTFTTATAVQPAPSAPASPTPADAAADIPVAAALGWAASSNATSYDVAFGTTNTPPVVSSAQAAITY